MGLIYHLDFSEGNGNQTKEQISGELLNINYVFNDAKYKKSCPPRWVKSSMTGYALDFDGYSTFIKDDPIEWTGSFTVNTLLAPRVFEACHKDVATTIIDQLDKTNKTGFALSLFRHGEVQFELGDGKKIYQMRTESSIALFKRTLLTITYEQECQRICIYIDSESALEAHVERSFEPATIPLSIGLNNTPFKIGNYFYGGMFAGLIDYIKIFNYTLTSQEVKSAAQEIANIQPLTLEKIDLDDQKLLDDVHRPQYHALPPQHWMNEPHAPFYYNGKYHLFYQKNSSGPYFSNLHWGHWTSDDLVVWKNEKTALFPQKGDLSPSGVWSGSATIGPEGTPLLFYTFANFAKTYNQGVAIARPEDIEDPHLVEWVMDAEGVISQTNQQGMPSQFRDPFVWRDEIKDRWYLIIGGGIEYKGPTTWIYTSTDCQTWQFKGEFYTANRLTQPKLGTNWELPVFLPISDNQGNRKYIFIFMSYFDKPSTGQADTYYLIGDFDQENCRFIPDSDTAQLFDYGQFKFSGPSGFVDPKTNKTIVFSILQGDRTEQEEYDSGWAHNAGLPIELYLENNELRMKPLGNLEKLRTKVLVDEQNISLHEVNKKLDAINDKMLEIIVEFEQTDRLIGLKIKRDHLNREYTDICYDRNKRQIWIDRTKTRLDMTGDIQGGKIELDEGLKAHIYIDHSAIECFFNQKKMIASRAYPTIWDSDKIALIGDDQLQIKSIKVYELKSIWKK